MDVLSPTHLRSRFKSDMHTLLTINTTTTTNTQHNNNFTHYNYPRHLGICCVNAISHKQRTHHQILHQIPTSDTFAWNNLIQTHLANEDPQPVLRIYRDMLLLGVIPDKHTLPRVLTASRLSTDLNSGKQLHCQALKLGFSSDKYVITALIELYGRLDGVLAAKLIFDKCLFAAVKNLVTWTVLARLYLKENKPNLAIALFDQMMCNINAAAIDPVALATAIRACDMLKSLNEGKRVHDIARKCGLEFNVLVSNSLLKMYVDCGSIEDARKVFDQMPSKDVISWSEVIRAYVKNGGFNESLKLFRQMIRDGCKPDSLSLSAILPACARMAAHKHGKEIHAYLLRNGVDFNLTVQNAIMDMYVKAGCIDSAAKVFAEMNERDIISWTVMILGHSLHGQGEVGVNLFHKMEQDLSIEIDGFAYYSVLHACCTARKVQEGRFYFNCIKHPDIRHCALMVALLVRVGLFGEAMSFIQEHGIEREVEVLRALLDGCRIHRQLSIGKQVIQWLCTVEPLSAENYVLLSNWYADHAKPHMADKCRETIRDMGLQPKKAYSWIQFRNKVHVFGTGDVSHPRSERIYRQLQRLLRKTDHKGCKPNSDFCLHDVDEERECIKIGHSEMLALSFGLINSQSGGKIRITKNLRMCRSCHDTAKIISNLTEQEIIIKDPNCFHHFKNGYCSCADFW